MSPAESLSVLATWEGGYKCKVATKSFDIHVDEPVAAGGEGTAPGPTDLLLASIASCYTLALAHVAKKRNIELGDLEVQAVGRYAGPKFDKITLTVRSALALDQLAPLLERASAVCYVSNTFRAVADIEVVTGG